jgi:hypothetical protein
MTIKRGKELLNKANATADELNRGIAALRWEQQYVLNSILIGHRDHSSGQQTVEEIASLIQELEEKLQCTN